MPIFFGESCAGRTYVEQSIYKQIETTAHLEHQGRIDSVLAGGSPVDVLARLSLETRRQHSHQWNSWSASSGSFAIECGDIEMLHIASRGDGAGCLLWDYARARFCLRQRRLECQHRAHMRSGSKSDGHGWRAEKRLARLGHRAMLRHRLKNTVSPVPCIMMSKR